MSSNSQEPEHQSSSLPPPPSETPAEDPIEEDDSSLRPPPPPPSNNNKNKGKLGLGNPQNYQQPKPKRAMESDSEYEKSERNNNDNCDDDDEQEYEDDEYDRQDNQLSQKKPARNNLVPFIIQSFNKEERQKERTNKPKLGLKRLTEDKKLVSVEIDIPLDENIIIKDKFDWDLSKDKISPTDFAQEIVTILKLAPEYVDKIRYQILSQIMEHLKTNTRLKVQEERDMAANGGLNNNEDAIAGGGINNPFNTRGAMRFTYNEYQEDDMLEKQENQKKKMSRMRRNDMKRANTYLPTQPNRYFKQKKICRNCKNQNNAPGFQCKNCRLPFELMQMLNFDDKRVKISVKYYEKIANKIPLLIYEAKKSKFEKEDFDSFYAIYNKIKGIFQVSDELSKENLNQVKYIMEKYHEYFLNGNLDFNDQQIIYDKDMKKGDKKDDDNRPKRARGRPRKVKIIFDDLLPNSNQGSEQDSSESDSGSSSYTSS